MDQFRQHAIETNPHDQSVFPWLNMDVAGLGVDSVKDQCVDKHSDLNAAFCGVRLQVLDRLIHGNASLRSPQYQGFARGGEHYLLVISFSVPTTYKTCC